MRIDFKFILTAFIFFFAGACCVYYFTGFNEKMFMVIKAATSILLALGVIYAARQFYLNQKQLTLNDQWNRQQLGLTEANRSDEKLEGIIEVLKEKFDYAERKEPYKISKIHEKFGKFTDGGGKFEFSDDGKKFKSEIIQLLNIFEYIATGVNLGIFDEEVVRRLMRGKLVYAYNMFSSYIHHLRIEHGWTNVYTELENLAKKWQENT